MKRIVKWSVAIVALTLIGSTMSLLLATPPTAFLLPIPSPNCAMPFLPSTTGAFPPPIFLSCGIHRRLKCHFIATHSFPSQIINQ